MKKNRYKEILVIDLEATCWKERTQTRQYSEIIEIGICEINIQNLEITKSEGIIVKPTTTEISDYCTELTSITQELVDRDGISFKDACEKLRNDYESFFKPWFSYGNYDRKQFFKQCEKENIYYPLNDTHINVKSLLSIFKNQNERGMARALESLEMNLEGRHHRGVDDARNISKILISLIKNYRKYFYSSMQ